MTIQKARRKFLGSRVWKDVKEAEDATYVSIQVDVPGTWILGLTLGELRALKADLEQNDAGQLLEACEMALSFWQRYIDRTGAHEPWAVAVRNKLLAAVEKAGGKSDVF